MERRTVLSYGSLKLPDFAKSFFKTQYEHTAFIRTDNFLFGAIEGCTWRVYPGNLHMFRENFFKQLEKIMQWASRCGAEARIVSKHFPQCYAMCRRGDYIVFSIGEPVATTLEQFGCLARRYGFNKTAV